MGLKTMKRRRREHKTDYKLRIGLLKSGLPRIVIRKTNKYFIIQAVETKEGQDRIIKGISSKELLKIGWAVKKAGSLKSIPAGYLTGKLFAKKLKKVKKGKFIVDLGMARAIKGTRIYAVVKGLINGGLKIPHDEKIFPLTERIKGEHLKPEIKDMIKKVEVKI